MKPRSIYGAAGARTNRGRAGVIVAAAILLAITSTGPSTRPAASENAAARTPAFAAGAVVRTGRAAPVAPVVRVVEARESAPIHRPVTAGPTTPPPARAVLQSRVVAGHRVAQSARPARPHERPSPADEQVATVIGYARKQLGKPYVWGATGPNAFDCSGLTSTAFRSVGVELPRTSAAQVHTGTYIPPSAGVAALRPGDLVFWATDAHRLGTVHHVALYIGGGTVIQAPDTGSVVKISKMWLSGYAGAARVLP